MKKNKTIAYMLAATLLVGGTFVGTKALFTDKIDTIGELAISTGDVDIEVVPNEEGIPTGWLINRNGNEYKDNTTVGYQPGEDGNVPDGGDTSTLQPFANNLKPGDLLMKTITVQNKGTLKAKLDLTANEDIQEKLGVLSGLITATGVIGDEDKMLNPGETTTLTLTLSVNNEGGEHQKDTSLNTDKGYNTDGIEDHIVNLNGAWVLNATQQNERISSK